MRRLMVILTAALIMSGCAAGPQPVAASAPVAGLPPATQRAEYSAEQLIQIDLATIGFAEWYIARIAVACDALSAQATTPEARREALQLKATQATSVYSIVAGPNPIVQVLDLAILVNLTHLKWIDEGLARQTFGERGQLLADALGEAAERGATEARRVVSEHDLAAVRGSVQRWRAANRGIADVEFIRFEDFVPEIARSLAPADARDFLANLKTAAAGLSESRLLGERSLFLMSRLPRIARWQLDAQLAELQTRPEVRQAVADLSKMTQEIGELKGVAGELHESIDAMPQKLVAAASESTDLKSARAATTGMIDRADAAVTQLATIHRAVTDLSGEISSLSAELKTLQKSYEPGAVQKMADEGKAAAVREARSLIYLMTACLAGLLLMNAALRRWFSPHRDAPR